MRWDIVGQSEVRREENELKCRKNRSYLYFYGETKSHREVGFYIKESVWKRVKEMKHLELASSGYP